MVLSTLILVAVGYACDKTVEIVKNGIQTKIQEGVEEGVKTMIDNLKSK